MPVLVLVTGGAGVTTAAAIVSTACVTVSATPRPSAIVPDCLRSATVPLMASATALDTAEMVGPSAADRPASAISVVPVKAARAIDCLVDPGAPAAAVLGTIETGLAAIDAAATAAVSGNSVLANLEAFAATVPSLLTGVDVKNAALQAKITSIVTLVTNEAKVLIPAVTAWVAQIKAANPTQG